MEEAWPALLGFRDKNNAWFKPWARELHSFSNIRMPLSSYSHTLPNVMTEMPPLSFSQNIILVLASSCTFVFLILVIRANLKSGQVALLKSC